MAKTKHNAQDIITAIEKSGGIKTTIAKRLGVHRHTIDNYLERFPTAKQAYENEVESIGDMAETVIISALQDKDIATAKWYANNKLKDRGYVIRQEHTGKDGEDISPIVNIYIPDNQRNDSTS